MAISGTSHLETRSDGRGRSRIYVTGTRLRVQDIALEHVFQGQTPEQIVREYPSLSLGQVHAALSYYFDHREQILAEINEDASLAESSRGQFRKPNLTRPGNSDAPTDSASS